MNQPILLGLLLLSFTVHAQQTSLRFYGSGVNAPNADRVKISIDGPHRPADVAKNFTLECWIKCDAGDNNGTVSAAANGDGWITGNIFFDRDVFGPGDYGDFGLSIGSYSGGPVNTRVVAFGIDRLGTGITIRGSINVADNQWHHVAVTRNASNGKVKLYIDGQLEASGNGPTGNVSYRNNRLTSYPNSDPFIVLGAEKHDAGEAYPSFNGYFDELRLSTIVRYSSNFTPPANEFLTDAKTAGLYHFNEGSGSSVNDVSGASGGPSNGSIQFGGSPVGPEWSADSPFGLKSGEEGDALPPAIEIFPNPNSGQFMVNIRQSGSKICITDLNGKLIGENNFPEAGLYPVQLPEVSGGVYFLHYLNREGNATVIQLLLAE